MLGLLPVRTSRSDVVRLSTVPAPVDPTVIDDADDGYRVGQRWVNTLTLTTWTLADATPGAAVWVQEDGGGGGGGGPVALGGDLGGTSSAGYVKTVRGVSATLTYDGNGRLSTLTSALGTKTMTYNPDGTLASIAGTGQYRSKTLSYSGGKLASVTVS
jgi:YD repeat-containing protein